MSSWDSNFYLFYLLLIVVVYVLMPIGFAVWGWLAPRESRPAKPSYRDAFGWVIVIFYLAAIFGTLNVFVIHGAIERADEHASDAWAFVLFALFCAGITLWLLGMCLTMMVAKIREVRKSRQQS